MRENFSILYYSMSSTHCVLLPTAGLPALLNLWARLPTETLFNSCHPILASRHTDFERMDFFGCLLIQDKLQKFFESFFKNINISEYLDRVNPNWGT